MTYSSVFVNRIDSSLLEPDYNEIFRYMGYGLKDRTELDDEVRKMVYQIVPEFQKILCPQGVYVFYPLKIENENLIFNGNQLKSCQLSRFLSECLAICLFAATIGPQADLQIRKMQKIAPVKAVIMQATGAMFIEKYCDALCCQIEKEAAEDGLKIKNRFSPGYGDVPLENQKIFFHLLDCKKIGLTLTDSLMMAPEKSVTAFVGCYKNINLS